MVRPEYVPPVFDPTVLQNVPFAEFVVATALPGIAVSGIGGFGDLNSVQHTVVSALHLVDEAASMPSLARRLIMDRVAVRERESGCCLATNCAQKI